MIVHTYRIPYKYGEAVRIKPLADIHLGNSHCDEKAARAWIDEDRGCYFIGNGDLLDCIITSDLKRYQKSSDGTYGDDIIDEQINRMYSWIKQHKDRIIGLGTGNHEENIVKRCGTNPSKRLCEMLETKYLGYSSLVKLIFTENGNRGRSVVFYLHHGYGGGSRTQGADITKYSKIMNHFEADVYLLGHVHKKQTDRIPRLSMSGDRLISKPRILGITGSFLKTYSKTTDCSYAERAGYPPTELGGLTINIKPNDKWVDIWVDM